MRNKEDTRFLFPVEPGQQLDNLKLHGNIQGRGRLVRYQKPGITDHGGGYHHALPLAS